MVIRNVLILFIMISSSVMGQKNPDKLFASAETAFDEGRYREALQFLNACLQEEPGFVDAYFMRAETKEQLRDLDGALTDYSILLDKVPNHSEGLLNRGQLRYRLKKYEQAAEDFRSFLRSPSRGATQRVYFNRQASVHGANQIMTAQSFNLPIVYNYLGLVALQTNHYREAVHWLDSAIILQQGEADYFVNRALAHQAMKDTAAALRDYERALKLNQDHSLALNNLSLLKRPNTKSSDLLTRAIEGDSSQLQPYLQRAKLLLESKAYSDALRDLTRALTIEDRDPEIWFTRGLVFERQNDLQRAYADYTKAIDLKEDHFKSWINRANVLLKLKRYQDAIDDYGVALVYHADFAAAFYNRAIALSYLGKYSEACADLKKAEASGMVIDKAVSEKFCQDKH